MDPFEAAAPGALAHARAGSAAAADRRRGPRGGRRRDRRPPACALTPSVRSRPWQTVQRVHGPGPGARFAPTPPSRTSSPLLGEHELPGRAGGGRRRARVVGIVTEDDLVMPRRGGRPPHPALHRAVRRHGVPRAAEPLRGAPAEGVRRHRRGHDDPRTSIRSRPDTAVHEAARVIAESGHNRLPVVEDGRLVGVITRARRAPRARRVMRVPSRPTTSARSSELRAAAARAAVRRREGERIRARDRAVAERRARRRRGVARGGHRGARRPSCARPGSSARLLVMGALTRGRAASRAGSAAPTSSRGREEVARRPAAAAFT